MSEGVRSDDKSFKVQPEQNLSAELGYLNQESDYFVLDSAVFYNRATNLIQLSSNRPITTGDLAAGLGNQDPATGFFPLFYGGLNNQCQLYNVYGAEVGVRTFPVEGLDVYANYTLDIVKQDNSHCTDEEKALIVTDSRTSAHKVNAGVQLRTKPGIDGSLDFHYVSPQTWGEQVIDLAAQRIEYQAFPLKAYTLLNGRIGYRFLKNHADVSVMAFNLLGIEHREHPFGQLIGRRVMGYFTYRF
jgi:iron complex outermembrane receptor protein